jgi:hypothetical protein
VGRQLATLEHTRRKIEELDLELDGVISLLAEL